MIISITKLQLKNIWQLLKFMNHAGRSRSQAISSAGVIHVDVKADLGKLTFYTLTAWENESSLREFMLGGHHKKAMKITKKIAKQAVSTNYEGDKIPDWQEALQILEEKKRVY